MPRAAGLKTVLGRLALLALPEPILYRLLHRWKRRRPRSALETAAALRRIAPQEGVEIQVYWSEVPRVGRGPSASLFVLDEEVLRLDCFGGRAGHMHLNPEQQRLAGAPARLYFPDDSRAAQVARAAFELAANGHGAAQSNRLRRVRAFPLDADALARAAEEARAAMTDLLARHGTDG